MLPQCNDMSFEEDIPCTYENVQETSGGNGGCGGISALQNYAGSETDAYVDCLLGDGSGGGGAGGGAKKVGPPSGAQYAGFSLAQSDLSKPACAKLVAGTSGSSASDLENDLWNSDVSVGTTAPGNGPAQFSGSAASWSYEFQLAYTQNGNIQLNGNFFPNPAQQNIATPSGDMTSVISLFNSLYNSNLGADQFGVFVFLHELSHIANGNPASTIDTIAYNQEIITDCIQ